MLAQWVPLHAVSCSNLIETGGCAESREIPLRVTQTCFWLLARARFCFLFSFSSIRNVFREPSDRTLLLVFVVYLLTRPQRSRSFLLIFERRTRRREARANFVIQDRGSRSSERLRSSARISDRGKSPTIVSLDAVESCVVDILRRGCGPAGRTVRRFSATFQRRFNDTEYLSRCCHPREIEGTREPFAFTSPNKRLWQHCHTTNRRGSLDHSRCGRLR